MTTRFGRPNGRRLTAVSGLLAIGLVAMARPATTPAEARAPLQPRSGTIIDGIFTTGPAIPCDSQPDCLAWRVSGCAPRLAGADPAWHTSIVAVADRAGKVRSFTIRRGAGESFIIGGVLVQFWTADCTEEWPRWSSFYECEGPPCRSESRYLAGARLGKERVRTKLQIPAAAAWMTISANDNVNVDWRLR